VVAEVRVDDGTAVRARACNVRLFLASKGAMRTLPASLALACSLALASRAEDAHDDAAKAYKIETSPALKIKKGETAQARVTVVPRADAHVSPDAPVSLTVSAGPDVELPKTKLGRPDAKATDAKGVEFAVPVVGKAAGKDQVKGQLTFFICTEKVCERQKRDVALAVEVE
jgi:hypothetical protein